MFRKLDYQDRVLSTLDAYLGFLKEKKINADEAAKLLADNPGVKLDVPDFAAQAWADVKEAGMLPASRAHIPFSPRIDGCKRSVPNAVLKVPTGGGKTWLAVSAVSRIMGRYLGADIGFVLWIVPNEAIYRQTLKNLKDRRHPYRQALDRAAAGRVRIMEKNDRLDARDAKTHLCVMLLMLQSAGRKNKETLKMFQDRGDVHGFFPGEGDQQAHKEALERTPNLSAYKDDIFPMVHDSLGNALRVIRPVVVLDEGHRAVSDLAFETLYGFNPCFVLELTATPQDVLPRGGKNPHAGRCANVLVEVSGVELDREGMIKMPLNLISRQGSDWKKTLNAAVSQLEDLSKDARRLRADKDRYIRPIMLVQVERTGKEQRESGYIHSEDVKAWLLTAGFDEAEIAVKTAETNDLNQPENQDLLSPANRVRAIITKQALQEGWDCPFAYILCALAASSNLKAMTQIAGRILRQPHAEKTGVPALDECYVITHQSGTANVVAAVKDGLERDGLGDLSMEITLEDQPGQAAEARRIERRPGFKKTKIYLPKVMLVEDGDVRELDYETDILSRVDWRGFDPKAIADAVPENARRAESQMQKIELADDGGGAFVSKTVSAGGERPVFDCSYAVRMISDLIPNPFVGYDAVSRMVRRLKKRGFDEEKIGALSGLIIDSLRDGLDKARAEKAEVLFKSGVKERRIQFRLRVDGRNWRMPDSVESTQLDGAPYLPGLDSEPVKKSLFYPVYTDDLNSEERDVAVYLDGEKALSWWHRNVARRQYGIQGWRRQKIYPDFVFAVRHEGENTRMTVLETKGEHLDNLDTGYKRDVLSFLSDNFSWDDCVPSGELELVQNDGQIMQCALVLMNEWKTELPKYL